MRRGKKAWPAPAVVLVILASLALPTAAAQRKLNNLVTELVNVDVRDTPKRDYAAGEPYKKFAIKRARDGWIFVSVKAIMDETAKLYVTIDDASLEKAVIAHEGKRPLAEPLETMRYVKAGEHTIQIWTTGRPMLSKVIVRSVPEIAFYNVRFMTPGSLQGPSCRVHRGETITHNNWAWLKAVVLRNCNVVVSSGKSRVGDTEYYAPYIKDWRARGGRWIAVSPLSLAWGKTAEEVSVVWRSLMEDPLLDGMLIDEFNLRPGFPKYIVHAPIWNAAIELIRANPKCEGKLLYAFNAAACTRHVASLVKTLRKTGYKIAMEVYLNDRATEEEARSAINRYLVGMARKWRKHFPGSIEEMVLYLGCANTVRMAWHKNPGVNYKVFLDMQFHAMANNAAFDRLGGVSFYVAWAMDQELVEWWSRLCRHYLIEGKRNLLSQDPYILPHLRDPGFEKDASGWTLTPALQGSIKVIPVAGTKLKKGGPFVAVPEGKKVLWTKRCRTKANTVSQTINELTPGRLYSLVLYTADAREPESGGPQRTSTTSFSGEKLVKYSSWYSSGITTPISIALEGVDVLPERSADTVFSTKPYVKPDKQYWTRHYRVFRATAATGNLLLSDWKSDTEMGGVEGQEIIWDFVGVQPYCEE